MLKILTFLKLEALSTCQRILLIHFHSLKLLQKILWIALGKQSSVLFPCRSCFFVVICLDHILYLISYHLILLVWFIDGFR
ncbi:hypothetical protein KSP39_PZI000990 [Platanthera zijinensis]|uniref:Uncharacterized protein n=1 Tax=Platanthera zijinensis TaxID=2320716 RepID=A0AAP0BZK9_9ASPA